jgi:hypothetical protein
LDWGRTGGAWNRTERRSWRIVAEPTVLVAAERLRRPLVARRLNLAPRGHGLVRRPIAPAAAQILRPHKNCARDVGFAGEHARSHIVSADRPARGRGYMGRRNAGVHGEVAITHQYGPIHHHCPPHKGRTLC